MKLNLEAKTKEQQRIKAYLEENASDILAGKINNGVLIKKDGKILLNRKTLDSFMSFATEEARKQAEKGARYAMVEDDVVFGWAVHYFEEDSIEGTLYNEDGSEYKTQPKPAAKAPTVKAQPKPQPKPQMSMFDLMDNDIESKPVLRETDKNDGEELFTEQEKQETLAAIAEEQRRQEQPEGSPLWQKYNEIQKQYPGCIVIMRLGDFYEVFGENAEILAKELSLTLTGRNCGLKERIPMVGFPCHASDMYFKKIKENGHSAVILDNDEIHELSSENDINLDTDEILFEAATPKFDGDMNEPDISNDEQNLGISGFDSDILTALKKLFGKEITVR